LDRHGPGEPIALSIVRKGVEQELPISLASWPAGENPFTTSADVGPRDLAGSAVFQYPFIRPLPGFSFPDIFPENP
jgi:hypothetical protein